MISYFWFKCVRARAEMSVVRTLSGSNFVLGLTCLGDELFVLRNRNTHQVEVYSTAAPTDHVLLRRFSVDGLSTQNDNDITACANGAKQECLYISDRDNGCIHKSTRTGVRVDRWPVPEGPNGLSLTSGNNLLVTCSSSRKLLELSSESGERLCEIELQSRVALQLRHAIQLATNRYLVSHCDGEISRVLAVDGDGEVSRSYGESSGAGRNQLNRPRHLTAADGDDFVLVADRNNSRLVLLSPDLQFVRQTKLDQMPYRLFLHRSTRRLYVGLGNNDVIVIQV